MVITCEECSTRFNLDESLLKKEGSKVRCCRCRHVFTAFPTPEPVLLEDMPPQEEVPTKAPRESQDEIDSEILTKLGPDAFSLDSELDLGFSVEPGDLTLDDDLNDSTGEELSPGKPFEDKPFDLGDSMDSDDFFMDDDLELDMQDLNLDQEDPKLDQNQSIDTSPEPSELSRDLRIDDYSDGTELGFDDDMEFENELELELEDYGDLDPLSPDTTAANSDLDMDFNLEPEPDPDLDLDLELNLDLDTTEPETDLMISDIQEQTGPDIDLDENDFHDEMESGIGLGGDKGTQDDLDLGFDLEMEPNGLDTGRFQSETDKLDQDEEINLSEFDEVLEAGEDDFEMESPEEFPLDDSLDTPAPGKTIEEEFSVSDQDSDNAEPDEDQKKHRFPPLEVDGETAINPPHLDYSMNEPFKKPVKTGRAITTILLLAILILAAYSACLFYGIKIPYISTFKIPYLSDLLVPEPPAPVPVNLTPDKQSVNGRFVTNATAGTLFVITGSVTNTSNVILNQIKVKGTLITKDKVKAKTKIASCGNLIDEDQLKNVDMGQINLLLARETGNNLSNTSIQPGRSIPFMIVFSDLPEDLENFTVNVNEFERKAKEN